MDPSVFVHELALCESDEIGPRTRVWAFAQVQAGAVVGADCNICGQVFVETGARVGNRVTVKNGVQVWDRVTLEDEVFVGPNASFTNDLDPRVAFKKTREQLLATTIGRGATVGAGAVIVCGVEIGEQAFVAAGAVVTRSVRAHSLVVGNPACAIDWVCSCAKRLGRERHCSCGRRYREGEKGLIELL